MKPIKFLKCVVRGLLPFYLFTFLPLSASAQKLPVWQDPGVNQQNREPRRAHFFAFESLDKAMGDKSASARFLSMEGMWKFCFVKNHQDAPKDFFSLKYDDSKWVDFPVPGLFEINGYGDKIYKNMGYAWCTTFENNPPYIGETNNYTGSYRREFDLPADWKGQEVFFHVGSATSNLSVWVNGKYVGYSEDSKVAAEFNLTKYLKPGKNLIAMQIMRWCDGSYLEDQDFWRFTGIAREVYLYATPKVHLQDITIGQDLVEGKGLLSLDAKIAGGKADVEATPSPGRQRHLICILLRSSSAIAASCSKWCARKSDSATSRLPEASCSSTDSPSSSREPIVMNSTPMAAMSCPSHA